MCNGPLRVTIPNHASIDVKTLGSILRQARITIEELKEDL
jgi:predicted RNA binding protein YcfA (HicA-like mRNA interferase family)